MNTRLTTRSICLIALGGWATLAGALSLGSLTGATVIGRPLELVAPIQFDEVSPAGSAGCVTAQVFYGDKVVERSQVHVDLGADAARQLSFARISSATPVDEPFVTVVLSAGCTRPSSRRYVVLAEAPGQEPMMLASAPVLGTAIRLPLASVSPAAAAQPRFTSRVETTRRGGTHTAGASSHTGRPITARHVAAREAAPRSPGRLQLALWDPNNEQLPWLRTSTEMKSSPTADAARRAAATSLWRALNAQPQDLLRTAERLRGLEGEMSSLRSLSARHRAEIESARESLQAARQRDHTTLLVVTLLALLAGSAAAWVWNRSRRPSDAGAADSWYAPMEPWADSNSPEEGMPAAPVAATPAARSATAVRPPAAEAPSVPAVMRTAKPAVLPQANAPIPPPMTFPAADAAPSVSLPSAAPDRPGLKVDALHGAQQQSEFFASLGQVDEAVAVLTSYLEESRERPVLVYLELFRIYHGTGMRIEYEELQSKFRQTFGMDVASFGQYSDEPRELDMYLLPVTRIASAWPSERSLEIIEELLFKRPATPRDLLSLEAYRDLVWLYSLGQEVVHHTSMPAGLQLLGGRGLPNDHFILPWADGEQAEPTELSLDRLGSIDVAPELSAFGVDIDLTAIRGDGRPASEQVHDAAPPPPVPPPPVPTSQSADLDAFDAAMKSESRRLR